MDRDDLVVKRHVGIGKVGDDEVEVQWIIHPVVNVQRQQVNPIGARCRRVGMNEGNGDGFGGLTFHGEIRFCASDVPRHGLTRFNVQYLTGLHGSVGGDEGRVGQRNVPRSGRDAARCQRLNRRGRLEFDAGCRNVHLNVKTVVVFTDFFHGVVGVDDEREGARAGGLRRPRPHDHFARAGTEFDRGSGQFGSVHLKRNGESIGFDVSKIEEGCRELDGIVHLRNGHVHLEIFGHHFRIGTKVVHTVAENGKGVGLRLATAVLGVFHVHRPGPLGGVVEEHDLEVVDTVPCSARR